MSRQIRREAGILSPEASLDDMAAAYAEAEASEKAREGGESYEDVYATAYDRALGALTQDHVAGRDQVAYYVDNGTGESAGIWWTGRRLSGEMPAFSSTPFRKCSDQGEVDGRILRDLARGRDPETREPLVRLSGTGVRSVGYDLQCAAPKSVSVLAAFASPEGRSKIFASHDRAVRRALDHALTEGLIVTRVGPQGIHRLPAREASAAIYRHFTSRAQDPHLHSHAVLLNLAVREDGTTGAIDNRDVLRHLGALAALYRSELASGLRNDFGFESIRDGRNFQVAGVPLDIIKLFSKRRAQIMQAAGQAGFDPSSNRRAAQIAAFGTRDAKDRETPLAMLEKRWANELSNVAWSGDALFRMAAIEAARVRKGRDKKGSRLERARILAREAVRELEASGAVFEQRALLRHLHEAVQCECDANETLAVVRELEVSKLVVRLGRNGSEEVIYSTAAMIEAEKAMLRTALEGRSGHDFVSSETLERALSTSPAWPEGHHQAMRHALRRNGVSIISGQTEAENTRIGEALAAVAESCGKEVWRIDRTKTDPEATVGMAPAVQAFIERVKKGDVGLGHTSVIICDDADRVGTSDMAALIDVVSQGGTGAKLILLGDIAHPRRDIAGAPMAALARALGVCLTVDAQHQRQDWHRSASRDFASGDPVRALEAYDRVGAICWAPDRETALQRLVSDYLRARPASAQTVPGQSIGQAIVTPRRKDVDEINRRVRSAMKSRALLGEDIMVRAIPQGSRDPVALALAAGDDLLFGEDLQVRGLAIRMGDRARIQRIQGDADPTLDLILAPTAAPLTTRVSELIGNREEGLPRIPRLQHGYCLSVRDAEGLVVDDCFVANLRGMGRESISAAMTRHRQNVRLYVDISRVADATDAGLGDITQSGLGRVRSRQTDRDHSRAKTALVKRAVMDEARASEWKRNPSDFALSVAAFASQSPMHSSGSDLRTPASGNEELFPRSVNSNSTAQALRDRMGERMSGPHYPPRISKVVSSSHVAARFSSATRHRRTAHQWIALRQGINEHLQVQLGIAPDVLYRFRSHIRTMRDGRPAFAHRDLDGQIIGFEYQGTGAGGEGKDAILGITGEGDLNFTLMGDTHNPTRMYFTQSGVDGLSLYQTDQTPDRALIVSFGGRPNRSALGRLRELVQRYPDAEMHITSRHGEASGDVFNIIKEAIIEACGGNANLQKRELGELPSFVNDQNVNSAHEPDMGPTEQPQPQEDTRWERDHLRRPVTERERDSF
ncbi:MobF family relaxase [Microvirga yunnanensis]|uniref:MobF family relaxase n=1 Tax=Microvirga yunnanensis TaxID=2953740 RepID=UPI0021C97CB9|nr:MobF family relaxase [Microvirga sp. HBU65207]